MCGIAGYFGSKKIEQSVINQTLQLMKRRGPNGEKFERIQVENNKACYLLHSRLSIIDLDPRSNQPFHYKDKTIVFNGEIYNYVEVREDLKKLGHSFVTQSDTEVLVHALDEWGMDALNKMEGMWAFALYDAHNKSLTLSRDPFGEKPLYIYESGAGGVYFGSEVKFLSKLLDKKLIVNEGKLVQFLVNGYKSLPKDNQTFFNDVESFPPATVRTYYENKIEGGLYWKRDFNNDLDISVDDACEHIRSLLISSVKQKLRSDVPLAFCLSGGVDSNSVIGIAKKILDYDVHAFSIFSADEKYDEKEDIIFAAEEMGINSTHINISSNNFLDNLKEIVQYHNAPVLTLTYYMNWQLYRELRKKGFSVAVMGTGGDEIFSGYYDHHNFYLADVEKNSGLFNKSLDNWNQHIKDIVRNPYLSDPRVFIKDPSLRDHIYLNNLKFSKSLKKHCNTSFSEFGYRKDSLLKNRMLNELLNETVPVSLNQDDLNCMHFSIENRSPLLSRDLVEFVQSLPVHMYVREGYAKFLLRKAMKDIVPNRVIERRKKLGLNTSIKKLIKVDDTFERRIFNDSPIYDIVKRESIEHMLNIQELPNSDSKFLFSFLSVKEFLEQAQ